MQNVGLIESNREAIYEEIITQRSHLETVVLIRIWKVTKEGSCGTFLLKTLLRW